MLAQADGNPMALIELARVIAADPAAGRRWATEPLPPTDRLAAIVAAEFAALPAATRDALRLLAAAALALPAGQADRVADLAGQVLASSTDPGPRNLARLYTGWALVWSNRPGDALATLLSLTADGAPEVAWSALGLAATVAYQTGGLARDAVLGALDQLEARARPGAAAEVRSWARASAGPFGDQEKGADLHRIAAGTVTDLATLGAAAWVLDETELAVAVLRQGLGRLRAAGVGGRSGGARSALEWACIDSGRWDEALAAAREASDTAAAYLMQTVAASADLAATTVYALRGELGQVGRSWPARGPRSTRPSTGPTRPGPGTPRAWLFLSPRTVASHLYRVYPKLGIAGRHQLRELAERGRAGWPGWAD